jgi:uroporphyrinogen-III synthase
VKVLVTRPQEDARRTAAELEARGHKAVVSPLFEVRNHGGPEIDLGGMQAVLATSANGIRALAQRTRSRDIPVFAVGPQTAEAARSLGFGNVKSADGDAAALAVAAAGWAKPQAGALYHPTGAQTKGGLAGRLMVAGFEVRSEILYDAMPITQFAPQAAAGLRAGEIGAVLLYSPRSAKCFVEAVRGAGLEGVCPRLEALCISEATAEALAATKFRAIRIAGAPNQMAMLGLLD